MRLSSMSVEIQRTYAVLDYMPKSRRTGGLFTVVLCGGATHVAPQHTWMLVEAPDRKAIIAQPCAVIVCSAIRQKQ